MATEGYPPSEGLTRLWETAWSGVTEGPLDALDEVITRFEEEAAAFLREALLTGDSAAAGAYSAWQARAYPQVLGFAHEGAQQQGHSEQAAAERRCFEEAARRGLTYEKVKGYAAPGDPYAFLAYARDHPEDVVAADLLRCLQAVGEASRAESEGLQRRKGSVMELYAAAQRAQSRAVQQWAAAQGAARAAARPSRACSLCGAVTPVGEDGRCGPCRAVVAASQGRGEATDQGWAIDPATVIPWGVLAAHIAALFACFGSTNEAHEGPPAEPAKPEIDPAVEEWIRKIIEGGQQAAKVVQATVEGGEPPTAEVIERIKMPFTQAFGASGGPAYAAAAFEHYAATDAWAWDPGIDLAEAMSEAARSALESLLPEGFLDGLEGWLRRLGIGSGKELPEGSTFLPEIPKHSVSRAGDVHWYCQYCGKRLDGMGEICRSCSDAERPWCRNCRWPRSAHTGERLFCPPRPRPVS